MGCGVSSPKVQNTPKRTAPKPAPVLPSQTIMTVNASLDSDERLKKSFEIITKDITKVASPGNQMTIACLTGDTFPILVAPIEKDDNLSDTQTKDESENQNENRDTEDVLSDTISLPIIAASYSSCGRLVCYSQLTFLTNAILQIEQTMKLVTRTINWLCDGTVENSPIGIFTRTSELNKTIVSCLKRLKMNPIEKTNLDTDLSKSKLVIITSDTDTSDIKLYGKLIEFSLGGGGILVFYNHDVNDEDSNSLEINNFLLHYGLSYTNEMINIDGDETSVVNACQDFNKIKMHNFAYLTELLTEILDLERPDARQLDKVFSDFRYYMNCNDERQNQSLIDLSTHAWNYLTRTNYSQNGLICRDISQCIVALLILELYRKIPLRLTKTIPEVEYFPGLPDQSISSSLSDFTRQIELPDSSWVTTGLYLPPGCIGIVKSPDIFPDISILVGSHSESLLMKEGPWKRWPLVTFGFSINDDSIEVGSQFGGIIYVSSEDIDVEALELDFEGFSEYPRFCDSDPSVWERTKDIKVPFGEIELHSLIFTLPTSYMLKLDLPQISEKMSTMHQAIINFLNPTLLSPVRIVFDVEVASDKSSTGYPIVETIDMIEPLLTNLNKPNIELFNLLVRISITDIRENCFDPCKEKAFATVAACLAFKEVFPDFTIDKLPSIEKPKLFDELWTIHTKGNEEWIPKTLKKFQDHNYMLSNVPEDMWISFVRELCRIGEHDFTDILDKIYPIPLYVSDSKSDNFPKFK